MTSINLDDTPFSSSTPIKQETFDLKRLRSNNTSVEDLLQAIDKNISSASLEYSDNSNNLSVNSQLSNDPTPIKPLNLRQQSQKSFKSTLSSMVSSTTSSESDDVVMEEIPKVPSFDELEYNTRINRTLSLSKLHGPRQLHNTGVKRSSSISGRLVGSSSTRDNSPSKKSVCFEESPPKVMEYHQLTPEHSDESYGENDTSAIEDTFDSKWSQKLKPSFHPLPPLPPKHVVSAPVSPQKETTLGSSDDDSQDFNLTREELKASALSLEQKLDLVLNNEKISERVQYDESFNGSGSPLKSMTKKEEEFIYSIKSESDLNQEQFLRDAAAMFEPDVRNNDIESKIIRLNPVLTRKSSNSSLKDDERILKTEVTVRPAIPSHIGDQQTISSQSVDDLVSQSTFDSFASASEIAAYEPEPAFEEKEGVINSQLSSNSVSTLDAEPISLHKKSVSLSESISSGISFLSSMLHKRTESGRDIKVEEPEEFAGSDQTRCSGNEPDVKDVAETVGASAQDAIDHFDSDVESVQSSVDIEPQIQGILEEQTELTPAEGLSLLDNQTQQPSPVLFSENSDISIEDYNLQPPITLTEENELSFSEELKETGMFNSSDLLSEDYRTPPLQRLNLEDGAPSVANVLVDDSHHLPEIQVQTLTEHNDMPKDNDIASQPGKISSSNSPKVKDENSSGERGLPSYDSLLFSDKEPEEVIASATPPIDYISIWHSQPKSESPPLQYSVRQRKVSPPTKVLKLLQRTISDPHYYDHDDSEIKAEASKSSVSLDRKDSFVATSFSRPSLINLDSSRRSSMVLEVKKETDLSSANTSELFGGPLLPNITADTSDFANAFKEWEAETSTAETGSADVATTVAEAVKIVHVTGFSDGVKEIWGNNDGSRSSSVDQDKIHSMLAQSVPHGEQAHVKLSSATAEVVVTKNEDQGIEIEFEQDDSLYNSKDEIKDSRSITARAPSLAATDLPLQDLSATPTSTVSVPKVVTTAPRVAGPRPNLVSSPVKVIKLRTGSPDEREFKPLSTRLVSTDSKRSAFDLSDDFDRVAQLQEQNYSVVAKNEIIVAKDSSCILDPEELNKDYVPAADDQLYKKSIDTRQANRISSNTPRAPLSALSNSFTNIPMNSVSKSSGTRIISNANSENENVDNETPNRIVSAARSGSFTDGLLIKKREVAEAKTGGTNMDESPKSAVALPSTDKGRLYVHINSLSGLGLSEIKIHKPSFKIYLDNGKHVISTSKLDLSDNVRIDKEFEVAIEKDSTDLFVTLKVAYQKPENELVEVYEKIPLNKNRFSRLIGSKPKYKVEKRFVTRKREKDTWDKKFANDGSYGKNKITFNTLDNKFTGKTQTYSIELFNEWTTDTQAGKLYKRPPYLIGKLDVTMLYIPRTSPLETLPPSIKIAHTIADHLRDQSAIRFEGYLFQEGGDCESWKRRFFKLEGAKLIAHHDGTKKPKAQINLLKVVDILHSGKARNYGNRRSFTDEVLMSDSFKLCFRNGEIINMNAETTESKAQWISLLEKVVELNKFHQPWVSLLAKNRT